MVFKNCLKSNRIKNSSGADLDELEEEIDLKTPINIAMRFGQLRKLTKISEIVL